MSRTLLLVSAAAEEAEALAGEGALRDYVALARRTGGELVFQERTHARSRGWRARLFGPHLRQAWKVARSLEDGDTLFADGEHIGYPVACFLALRRRRPRRLVMIAHYPSKPWKLALAAFAARVGPRATVVVHSSEQQRRLRRVVGRRWRVALVPYGVDTEFWRPQRDPVPEEPLVVAVGAEYRDYGTLARAADGLPGRVIIAGASTWARHRDEARPLPPNVSVLERRLDFGALRALYARASAVVVPLRECPNQFGVTVLLEAMAMGRPVIVTATAGQREVVRGPLVLATGPSASPLPGRGPHLFGGDPGPWPTGLYVPPGDVRALREAIRMVLEGRADPCMGEYARQVAVERFDVRQFVSRLVALLGAGE